MSESVFVSDPSLEGDSDPGLVGDEADGGAQHLVLGALDGVRLDADHLPAYLLKCQDLDRTGRIPFRKHNNFIVFTEISKYTDLSPLRVLDAGEAQVADAPAGVDAVDLQLRELKGGVEGLGTDPDHDGVDGKRYPLHHLLSEAIFTVTQTHRWTLGERGEVNKVVRRA